MLLVPRGSVKCAGFVALKKEGEAFNTAVGLDGFQKRQHFRNVVRYSCDEVGGNQVQKRSGHFMETASYAV